MTRQHTKALRSVVILMLSETSAARRRQTSGLVSSMGVCALLAVRRAECARRLSSLKMVVDERQRTKVLPFVLRSICMRSSLSSRAHARVAAREGARKAATRLRQRGVRAPSSWSRESETGYEKRKARQRESGDVARTQGTLSGGLVGLGLVLAVPACCGTAPCASPAPHASNLFVLLASNDL